MARKGKEPAGLRRWRLAQKRKNSPKRSRSSAPKRTVKHMAPRRYGKRRGGHRKSSMIGMVRGLVYVGLPAATTYTDYKTLVAAGHPSSQAAKEAVQQWAGIGTDGKFRVDTLIGNWTPVAAWTAVDWAASKVGIYRKIGRLLRFG